MVTQRHAVLTELMRDTLVEIQYYTSRNTPLAERIVDELIREYECLKSMRGGTDTFTSYVGDHLVPGKVPVYRVGVQSPDHKP